MDKLINHPQEFKRVVGRLVKAGLPRLYAEFLASEAEFYMADESSDAYLDDYVEFAWSAFAWQKTTQGADFWNSFTAGLSSEYNHNQGSGNQ